VAGHTSSIVNQTGTNMEQAEKDAREALRLLDRDNVSIEDMFRALFLVGRSLGVSLRRPRGTSAPTRDQIAEARREAERAASAARVQDGDTELRLEVIEELVAKGVARHVAANRTNTTPRMLAEARELGII
jgi:hypothetical protein